MVPTPIRHVRRLGRQRKSIRESPSLLDQNWGVLSNQWLVRDVTIVEPKEKYTVMTKGKKKKKDNKKISNESV